MDRLSNVAQGYIREVATGGRLKHGRWMSATSLI